MTVLALDPGPEQTAWVRWDGTKILGMGIEPNLLVMLTIEDDSCWVDRIAIEMIASYGKAVGREVFETCVWIGRFLQIWETAWAELAAEKTALLIPRLHVKVHLGKTAKANDANVRQALIARFGEPGTKKNKGTLYGVKSHIWAALAVAVCAHDKLSIGAL